MKTAIIMGPGFSFSGARMYEKLRPLGVVPIGICPKNEYKKVKKADFEIRPLRLFGQINKIPLLRQAIQYFRPYNFFFLGFERAIQDVDVIHSVETFNIYTYQALKTEKPVVLTVWENIPFNNQQRYYKKIKKLAFAKTKKFIAITEKSKRVLMLEGVDEERIEVIPAGIDVLRFRSAKKNRQLMERYEISEKSKNILLMGSLIERKGVIDTLHAFYKLVKDGMDVNLLIAGSGGLKKKLPKMAKKLGIGNRVKILDFVPYDRTPEIFNLCEVFCLPSRPDYTWEEQFGMVFLEAMACERPVVSTLTGSIPEVVIDKKTGILVQPGDVLAIADAMGKLLKDDGLRKKLGKQGREWVVKKFDAEQICKKLTAVYEEVLK